MKSQMMLSPYGIVADNATAESPDEVSGSALSPNDPLVAAVGAFAYCIEATESPSRVMTYFLQQKVDMRRPENVSSWLTSLRN
jgi:hypothetical protein